MARLKAALEKVQYSSRTNCTIDEEDEFEALAAMMTLLDIGFSSGADICNILGGGNMKDILWVSPHCYCVFRRALHA